MRLYDDPQPFVLGDADTLPPHGPDATRRRLLQAGAAVGLGAGLHHGTAAAVAPLEAYASATSVRQGARIDFHVRDPGGSLTADTTASVTFVRLAGWVDLTMGTGTLAVRNRAVPADVVTAGCRWPVSTSLTVPTTWPSGLYYAFFLGATGSGCTVPFVVRPAAGRTSGVDVLVQITATTAQAQNNYGGKSLEPANSSGGVPAGRVSFDRPFAYRFNYAFDERQAILARWLDRKRIRADYCTNVDAHAEAGLLTGYRLLVSGGLDRYWTLEQRDRFDAFVAAGGNAALLGARACEWQARLEPAAVGGAANRTMVCWRDPALDPDTRAAYQTTRWEELVPPRSAASSTGLRAYGPEWLGTGPVPRVPYRVQVPHWIYDGTGLKPGDTFGTEVSGPLMDRVYYQFAPGLYNGSADPAACGPTLRWVASNEPRQQAPADVLTLLASADANAWPPRTYPGTTTTEPQEWGLIGIFSRGGTAGTVFNAGTVDWVLGLVQETRGEPAGAVARMTANAVTRLSTAAHRESAEVKRFRFRGGGIRVVPGAPLPKIIRFELAIATGSTLLWFGYPNNIAPLGTNTSVSQDRYLCRGYPKPVAGAVPVFRFYGKSPNGTHRFRYALTPTIRGGGWTADGIAFYAFATPAPDTEPVYEYYIVGDPNDPAGDPQGWYFLYSRHRALPEPLDCEPGGVPWAMTGVAFWAPRI